MLGDPAVGDPVNGHGGLSQLGTRLPVAGIDRATPQAARGATQDEARGRHGSGGAGPCERAPWTARLLIAGANERDGHCAHALAGLCEVPHPAWVNANLRDCEGLDPVYKAAIDRATPRAIQAEVLENPVWRLDIDLEAVREAAAIDLDCFAPDEGPAFQELTPQERLDLEHFREGHLRRMLEMPHGLTGQEEATADAAERALQETFAPTEHATLPSWQH